MISQPSYLHNGISYTGKTTSLYWIRAQLLIPEYSSVNTRKVNIFLKLYHLVCVNQSDIQQCVQLIFFLHVYLSTSRRNSQFWPFSQKPSIYHIPIALISDWVRNHYIYAFCLLLIPITSYLSALWKIKDNTDQISKCLGLYKGQYPYNRHSPNMQKTTQDIVRYRHAGNVVQRTVCNYSTESKQEWINLLRSESFVFHSQSFIFKYIFNRSNNQHLICGTEFATVSDALTYKSALAQAEIDNSMLSSPSLAHVIHQTRLGSKPLHEMMAIQLNNTIWRSRKKNDSISFEKYNFNVNMVHNLGHYHLAVQWSISRLTH